MRTAELEITKQGDWYGYRLTFGLSRNPYTGEGFKTLDVAERTAQRVAKELGYKVVEMVEATGW